MQPQFVTVAPTFVNVNVATAAGEATKSELFSVSRHSAFWKADGMLSSLTA
jgi:hypothetical protein